MEPTEDAIKKRAFEGFHRVLSDSEIYKSKDFDRAEVMVAMKNFVGLAFKAYDEPEVDGLKERMSKGKRIQHLNHEIASSTFEGALKIYLKEAHNVIDSDIALTAKNRRSDPYVVFSSGKTFVKSEFIKKTRNPVWNSTHYLLLRKHHIRSDFNEKLSVDLFDDDKHQGSYIRRKTVNHFVEDDLLGSAEIDLKLLKEPGVHVFDLKMKDAKGVETEQTVSFTVEFITFDTACEEMDVSSEGSDWMVSTEAASETTGTSVDSMSMEIACPDFEPFAYVEVRATNTQAWLYVNRSAKMVVISFRGTQPNKIKDILTDVNIVPVKLGNTFQESCILKARCALRNPNIRVHQGFLKAYRSIREAVLQLTYDVTQWDEEWNICTTGHSLGGALATLCAFEFSNRRNEKCGPVVGMMNFGAPRVGNEAFTSACNKTIAGSFRIVSKDDIIHLVPHHFSHIGKECLCLPDGEVEISDVSTRNANVEATIFTYAKEILQSDSTKAAIKLLKKRGQEAVQAATNHVRQHYSKLIDEAIKKFMELACSEEPGDEKAAEVADKPTEETEMGNTLTLGST